MKNRFTKEQLKLECKTLNCSQIANKYNTNNSVVIYWLMKFNIPIKKCSGGQNFIDRVGEKYGKLLVIKRLKNKANRSGAIWLCQCECGNQTEVEGNILSSGRTKSCGCLQKEACYKGYMDLSHSYWRRIERGAKSRRLELAITIQEAWDLLVKQNYKCALSGLDIKLERNYTKNYNNNTASLDRIDSSKGYIKENVQWVHKDINIMKLNFSEKEFLFYCQQIAKRKCLLKN